MEPIASTSTPAAISSPRRKCDEGTGMTPDEEMEEDDEDEDDEIDEEIITGANTEDTLRSPATPPTTPVKRSIWGRSLTPSRSQRSLR